MRTLVSIPAHVAERMLDLSCKALPNETGGALFGAWLRSDEVTIVDVSDAGPAAHHGRFSFAPDSEHLDACWEEIHRKSHGLATYLGDWHSHPADKVLSPSFIDYLTVRRIARNPSVGVRHPLMLIIAPTIEPAAICAWCLKGIRLSACAVEVGPASEREEQGRTIGGGRISHAPRE